MSLFARAAEALAASNPDDKLRLTRALAAEHAEAPLSLESAEPPAPIGAPGRPEKPELVPPRELVHRRLGSLQGRAALIHSVCHIEFNAINLALDAVYRFRGLPAEYYVDWLKVAKEEALHFELLRARLRELGFDYGDFTAHNGLWEMAEETAHDHLVRMALVPRVLEARGLDVTPAMLERLTAVGDEATVAILHIILRDEVGHVAIGSRWFKYACGLRGVEPEATFRELLGQYLRGKLKGPFNRDARLKAGFSEDELSALETLV